jgi:PAS domain S-box-containing protein
MLNITLSSIADFAYTFDRKGRFIYANQALAKLLGRTPDEMVGKNFHDLNYPAELADRLQRQIEHVVQTKAIVQDETPFTNPAGVDGYYEYIFRPVLGADGTVEVVAGSTRDITERKKSEEAFRESEERFRQFAENSGDVFWIVNARTQRLEYVNPVYEKMWGEPRRALMKNSDHWLERVHPDDREMAATRMPRVMKGQTVVLEYRIIRPDDRIRWIRDTAFPIRDRGGEIYRVAGVAQDVTDDKNRAEELRYSEERFRLLVEGARDYAMFLLDRDNVITFWSAGAERVFGWTQEEVVGQRGEIIFTPEDRKKGAVEKEMQTALTVGRAPDRRFHLRKDGSRFWADGVLMRLDEQNTLRGFAKVARDATDQRNAEDELRHARDEQEQRVIERTRDLMATNAELERTMAQRQQLERELLEISEREKRRIGEDLHDMVCQELTATALFLKSTAKKLAQKSPAAAQTLEESALTVNRNVGLARELARGLQAVELTAAGLKNALRALAVQACDNSGIKCHFKAARGVRVVNDTVALHLYRIAQEATTNAVKHSCAKNVLITLDCNPEHICVSVQDDGKGFAVRARRKGLGLHMMRYRANALGGELKIERRRRGGMDITCVIPARG